MYLKAIEVQGFKSFANRTRFEFRDGITAVVGPNGSGKSNVADAIRWVLGEQRAKQLRGSSMQDVIFSGTENRKPLSYASVSITLDNSDHALPIEYEEVTVMRRLYRSGESEYLMNGTQCRLKDINELFYDTGIGREGYSIIGQGQIDRILSEKPEDRRELFDEAAGIVKFKRRKAMTQKKLDDERGNLTRVSDILGEIEKQLVPLEQQSQTAKEYLRKKEELKVYDINMFLLETERLTELKEDAEKQLSIVCDELTSANEEFEQTKVAYHEVEDEIDMVEDEIQMSRDQLSKTTILKQQLEGQIDVLKEQINTVRMNDEHLAKRAESIHQEVNDREEQLKNLKQEQDDVQEKLTVSEARVKECEAAAEKAEQAVTDTQKSIDDEKSGIMDMLDERTRILGDLQKFQIFSQQSEARIQELKEAEEAQSSALKTVREAYETQASETAEAQEAIAEKTKEREVIESAIETLQSDLNEKSGQLEELTASYHRENSRLESLRNITERYDGYGNSIRKVMEQKDRVKGLIGVVADIVQTEKKYETAIETALGGNIQNIVVDHEDTAKKMIAFLKENRFGRATFLPMNSIKGRHFDEKRALSEPGAIGIADTLVTVDPAYKEVASYLLGGILIVDHIDHAIAIARKYRHSIRIVTLEGDQMNPGGSMTGGAFRNAGNLLSRRRELEDLEVKVQKIRASLTAIKEEVEKEKKERAKKYADLDLINGVLHSMQLKKNTLDLNLEAAKKELDALTSSVTHAKEEARSIRTQLTELTVQKEQAEKQLSASEESQKAANQAIEEAQEKLAALRVAHGECVHQAEAVRLEHAELKKVMEFHNETEQRLHDEIEKYLEELDGLSGDKSDTASEISQKEQEIADLKKTIEESADLFTEIQAAIDEAVEKKEALNKRHRSFIDKRESLSRHVSELDKEQFRLTNKRDGYEESLDKQIAYMWEEYEITYNHAKELRDESLTNLANMKKRINALKSEMKALGPVNVNAIEEYKELLERFTFLDKQRNDLVEAEESLQKIIEELDKGMRAQFTEQFGLIQKQFDTTFKKLFGGGVGTLEMVEGEDVLDAGIRIIAQPPGKKLVNMSMMSGGEKALTAIALLFAIQNLKPSPFCMLDEIEAALDDANVNRFADYLKLLTAHTQFIMITHRRGTMEVADRLYGVTMQEKGISTLVSVDLIKDKLDA